MFSVPVNQATAPQPDWWRAMGMPFQHTTIWKKEERRKYAYLFAYVCVCVHVKGERWLALAVKGK